MSSIGEIAGMMTAAGVEVTEARTLLESAQEAIKRAERVIFEVSQEMMMPYAIQEYMAALTSSESELDKSMKRMDRCSSLGQEYIQRLYA